ncbi:hypothetical protein [Amycolatopsis eburnea]|uniref:Uncharacterized protein n=1 Tax=Amycolatopsis eburnea TaxID=2267691 RepID=A0A427SZB5_9PSEU|nr:hypothetical protein [Amycolatopsis eburnea]RSD10306.1 hypothetical protein EIY87_36095 [Amycolatopsis eburnea]
MTSEAPASTAQDPAATLVPGTAAPPTWVWYVTAAAAVLLGLLTLRWTLTQLTRRPPVRTWRFEADPDRGRTELATDTAVTPFTEELRAHPDVHQARATLAGTREAPSLALVITLTDDGHPQDPGAPRGGKLAPAAAGPRPRDPPGERGVPLRRHHRAQPPLT